MSLDTFSYYNFRLLEPSTSHFHEPCKMQMAWAMWPLQNLGSMPCILKKKTRATPNLQCDTACYPFWEGTGVESQSDTAFSLSWEVGSVCVGGGEGGGKQHTDLKEKLVNSKKLFMAKSPNCNYSWKYNQVRALFC